MADSTWDILAEEAMAVNNIQYSFQEEELKPTKVVRHLPKPNEYSKLVTPPEVRAIESIDRKEASNTLTEKFCSQDSKEVEPRSERSVEKTLAKALFQQQTYLSVLAGLG